MIRDPRYDVLFEPVQIGPVTARNRFYQVPHCNGMGHAMPNSVAGMRAMKAEGGWAVVATEECDIHASSDVLPYREARLWDQGDQDRLALMTERVHEHGALAAVELVHSGHNVSNRYSRLPVLGVSDCAVNSFDPVQACAMTRRDIADVRRWHRQAALRARDAGFDIVYVYAGHDLSLPMHFISRRHNRRTDEYGGSLENRVRLVRELIEDTKDAVGDTCAVAVRFSAEQGGGGSVADEAPKDPSAPTGLRLLNLPPKAKMIPPMFLKLQWSKCVPKVCTWMFVFVWGLALQKHIF